MQITQQPGTVQTVKTKLKLGKRRANEKEKKERENGKKEWKERMKEKIN